MPNTTRRTGNAQTACIVHGQEATTRPFQLLSSLSPASSFFTLPFSLLYSYLSLVLTLSHSHFLSE